VDDQDRPQQPTAQHDDAECDGEVQAKKTALGFTLIYTLCCCILYNGQNMDRSLESRTDLQVRLVVDGCERDVVLIGQMQEDDEDACRGNVDVEFAETHLSSLSHMPRYLLLYLSDVSDAS